MKIKGTLEPKESKIFQVPFQVKRISNPAPKPIQDLSAFLSTREQVSLTWTPVKNANKYLVYRRYGKEILSENDLLESELIGKAKMPCINDSPEFFGHVFYAVIAESKKGVISKLDPEEGSSTVIILKSQTK